MKGFVIFNNKSGGLVYHRYYAEGNKLTKLPDHSNPMFDNVDPLQIASHFYALLKMTELMVEEYKSEHSDPSVIENDVNVRMSLKSGFRSFKSENMDYFLEHHETFPLTIVLFYDSDQMQDTIMRSLTVKILDVFVYKFEKKFQKGNFNIRGGGGAAIN